MTGRTRAARRLIGGVAVVALGAGCGSAVSGPIERATTARAVGNALKADSKLPGVQVTVSLAATSSQLLKLDQESGDDELTPAQAAGFAKGLAGTHLVFDAVKKGGLSEQVLDHDPANAAELSVGLQVNGIEPIEIREVGGVLYGHLQTNKLVSAYGQDPAQAAGFLQTIRGGDSALPGLATLANGGWVKVNAAQFGQHIEAGLPSAERAKLQQQNQQAETAFRQVLPGIRSDLKQHATFTNEGTSGGRTRYQVSIASRPFVEGLASLGNQLYSSSISIYDNGHKVDHPLIPTTISQIPVNHHTVLDVFVKDNRVSEADIDLSQFDHTDIPGPLVLRLTVDSPAPVVAPAGAVNLDVSAFYQQFVHSLQQEANGQFPFGDPGDGGPNGDDPGSVGSGN